MKQNKYAKEKIEKAQLLDKHSIWRTWKDITVKEIKGFLGVVMNMGMNPKCNIKEYYSSQSTNKMPFFVDVFSCKILPDLSDARLAGIS